MPYQFLVVLYLVYSGPAIVKNDSVIDLHDWNSILLYRWSYVELFCYQIYIYIYIGSCLKTMVSVILWYK